MLAATSSTSDPLKVNLWLRAISAADLVTEIDNKRGQTVLDGDLHNFDMELQTCVQQQIEELAQVHSGSCKRQL